MSDEYDRPVEAASEGVPGTPAPSDEPDITTAASAGDVAAGAASTPGAPEEQPEAVPTAASAATSAATTATDAATADRTPDPVADPPADPTPDPTADPMVAPAPDGGPEAAPARATDGATDGATGGPAAAVVGDDAPLGTGSRHDEATPPLPRILEAILLVVDEPVPAVDLAQVVEAPRAVVEAALDDLAADYRAAGRGFELRQVAGGWRLYTAPDCAAYVERFVLDGQQARLTQASLETLAVIAYRQPVSRQTVAAIRGVNVDGVVRTLVSRGLIAEAGQDGPGGAHLYVTTPYFLERLGLRSLDELPNLAPLLPSNIDDLADQA